MTNQPMLERMAAASADATTRAAVVVASGMPRETYHADRQTKA